MADPKIQRSSFSDRWISGITPIYYWMDGTKLRLTDRAYMPVNAIVLGTYESMDHIPQDIVDRVIEHNKDDIRLTRYREKLKDRITDEIKVGRIQSTETKIATPKFTNDGSCIVFDVDKIRPLPTAIIKIYDGGSYWVDGEDSDHAHPAWWEYMKTRNGDGVLLTPAPDLFSIPFNKAVDGVNVVGHFRKDFIEVRAPENRPDPLLGGYMIELSTPGVYGCSGMNWFNSGAFNYGVVADSRYYFTHITNNSYESVANAMYEGYFDSVLAGGEENTINPQLGKNHTMNLKVGVTIDEESYAILTPPLRMDGTYTLTKPLSVVVTGGQWIDVATSLPWVQPHWGDLPSQILDVQPFEEYGRSIQGRYGNIAVVQQFSKKHDSTLHLSYHDEYGSFCDFNISDTTNYCMSETKGEYTTHSEILIPHNSNPIIEVILIPAKWKYWVWIFGVFHNGSNYTPKYLCTSFEGSAASDGYGNWFGTYGDWYNPDPGEWTWIDDIHFDGDPWRRFMYWSPPSMLGLPQNMYNRWSEIYTPSGVTYGPVYTDPFIENAILCSRSLWLRLGADINGTRPTWKDLYTRYCAPGYSAWMPSRTAGQLAAIVRVTYDNGVTTHRYVYAKTTSTDAPKLMAYSHIYGQTAYGGIDGMLWSTPPQAITNWGADPPLDQYVEIENNIDIYYRNLYDWYINEYW